MKCQIVVRRGSSIPNKSENKNTFCPRPSFGFNIDVARLWHSGRLEYGTISKKFIILMGLTVIAHQWQHTVANNHSNEGHEGGELFERNMEGGSGRRTPAKKSTSAMSSTTGLE